MLVSQYNQILVVISFVVAILAAYTALNMAARAAGSRRRCTRLAGRWRCFDGDWRVGDAFHRYAGDGSFHEHELQRGPDRAFDGYRH